MKVYVRHGEASAPDEAGYLGDFPPSEIEALVRLAKSNVGAWDGVGGLTGNPDFQFSGTMGSGEPFFEIIYPEA